RWGRVNRSPGPSGSGAATLPRRRGSYLRSRSRREGGSPMPDYADTLIRVAAVVLVALVLTRLAVWLTGRIRSRIDGGEAGSPGAKRAHTLAGILKIAAVIVIWLLAAFTMLDQLGVQVGPMLAAAGVGGIAIGLGA